MTRSRLQRGASLLESLVALVIFSVGTLGLVSMYATAVGTANDAQLRADAAAHANDLVNAIWLAVERDATGQVKPGSLERFKYSSANLKADGPRTAICNGLQGTTPEATVVKGWLARVASGRAALPAAKALIAVEESDGNRVSVVLCWSAPRDRTSHIHETVAFIN